jgi:hypothetical protein
VNIELDDWDDLDEMCEGGANWAGFYISRSVHFMILLETKCN